MVFRGVWLLAVGWALCCLVGHAAVPEDPDGVYAEAYLRGDYAEALATLESSGGTTIRELPLNWAFDRAELLFILGRGDEALVAMRDVVQSVQEPYYTVRLAEMLRELGRSSDAEQALQWAFQQNQAYYQRQQFPERNLLALGRLARLKGENPNRVLQIYQQRVLSRYPEYVPGFIEAGELALDSYAYDIAEDYFEAALSLEPDNQDGLAGLAETYWKAGDLRFDVVGAHLESLNPHHPRLQCMIIARRLEAGETEAAEVVLADLLGTNPNHRLGLAYRAAAAFLVDDEVTQSAALVQLATLDPTRGDGYRIVGEVAARHYRFSEAVDLLRKGLALEPKNGEIQSALGLNLLRLGLDDEGRSILETAFDQDRFNVELYNMLEVLDTVGAFATVATPAFEIRLPDEEAAAMGGAIRSLLDEALTRYEAAYAVKIQTPVHVQIFDDHDEFMVRSVGLPGNPGHLGICFGGLVTLDSPRARPPRSMNWQAVLWHEFVHVITLQKTNNRIPRWLSEGISVYEEGQRDPAWGQPLQPEFKPLLDVNAWPGVRDLEPYFIRPESSDHLMLGYFLAGEFVSAYVADFGPDALNAALEQLGTGAEVTSALTTASGEDLESLDRRFGRHLARVCKPLTYLHRRELPKVFIPKIVTPSFPLVLEKALAADASGDEEHAIALFEEAAQLYPDYPGEDNPLRQLVKIHRASGDYEAWTQAVARLCGMDSTAYDEPQALMTAAAARSDWASVLTYGDWCLAIDPFDVRLYESKRQAQEGLGQREALLETLTLLAALDQVKAEEYQLERARILMALDRREEARMVVLSVLERFPEYRAAQEVLLALHEPVATEVPHDS